jgi:hypothetical protein
MFHQQLRVDPENTVVISGEDNGDTQGTDIV